MEDNLFEGDIPEDIFGDLSTPQPKQLRLPRQVTKKLRLLGIRELCFIDYDEMVGPILKYYISKRSRLYREMLRNPAFLPDLLLLMRDMQTFLLKDERTLIIMRAIDPKKQKAVLAETTKEFEEKVANFLDKLLEKLSNNIPEENELINIVSETIGELVTDNG